MDTATVEKFKSSTGHPLSPQAHWETAPAVFRKLDRDFGPFTWDLTANETNRCCLRWFGPGSPDGDDALAVPWVTTLGSESGIGYSNPPYGSFVPKILKRASWEARYHDVRSVFLLPLRVTRAFKWYVMESGADVWLCSRRLIFWEQGAPRINPLTGKPDTALFDSIVVAFGPLTTGRWRVWEAPTPAQMRGEAPFS